MSCGEVHFGPSLREHHCLKSASGDDFREVVSPVGLAIAALAEENEKLQAALIQANETAEEERAILSGECGMSEMSEPEFQMFEIMRENRKELVDES